MTHLREVVHLDTRGLDRIQRIRGAAGGALEYLSDYLALVQKWRRGVQAARTVERVVYRYARWVGCHRQMEGGMGCYCRELQASPLHQQAVEILNHCIAEIGDIFTDRHPWMSLPHFDNTKWNALRKMDEAIRHIETAIAAVLRLQGHVPPEGSAA